METEQRGVYDLRSPYHQSCHVICVERISHYSSDYVSATAIHVMSFVFPSVLAFVVFTIAQTPALPIISEGVYVTLPNSHDTRPE